MNKNNHMDKLQQNDTISMQIPAGEPIIDIKSSEYELEYFINIQNKLNDSKSQLDFYYDKSKVDAAFNSKWLYFQNMIDLYKSLRFNIERQANALHVTNAWLKYWEIYKYYDLIPAVKNIVVFFNAELPGAALCAFNHYIKTEHKQINMKWFASSLAPSDNSEALPDKYGLYANNKDHWLMQIKSPQINNGDCTDIKNLLNFADKIGPNSIIGGVDLYSSDAGIDVSSDFNHQEESNAKIHLGCALAGFLTLKQGGSFIVKQYTFFKTLTWNLILIYATMFEKFYICKPLTSRPYNSEIYMVGKSFTGLKDNIKSLLFDKLIDFNMRPLIDRESIKVTMPDISNLCDISTLIFEQQCRFIDQNIKLFAQYGRNLKVLKNKLKNIQTDVINKWLHKYTVTKINPADQLKSN